jgi:hypothetical protein
MANSLAVVVSGLAALGGSGVAAGIASIRHRRPGAYAPGTHANRDDLARNPLARPLRHGFASLAISVRLDRAGRLRVGTDPAVVRGEDDPGATIGPAVLRPLAERAACLDGRVHAAQRGPFTIMVDIRESDPGRLTRAYQVLDGQLRRYPHLFTRATDGIVVMGPVIVMLTGEHVPRQLIAAEHDRVMFCDGTYGDLGPWGAPPSLVPVVSEHWAWRFGWDGRDEMPVEERHLLCGLVQTAQAEGRRVRYFGIPARPARVRDAYWRELAAAGVDLISTDELRALARFQRRQSRLRRDARASRPVEGQTRRSLATATARLARRAVRLPRRRAVPDATLAADPTSAAIGG